MGALIATRRGVDHALRRYGLAIAVSLIAILLTWILAPLTQQTRFIFFFAAVAINAFYCGFGPAMLCLAGFLTLHGIVLYFFVRRAERRAELIVAPVGGTVAHASPRSA